MKIAMVSNLFWPTELGGYEILCRQVSDALAARGHEIVVLTSRGQGPERDALGALRLVRTLELTEPFEQPATLRSRRSPSVERRNRHATLALFEQERPDAVFLWSLRRLTLGPAKAARQLALPHLFTLNDAWPQAYAPRAPGLHPREFISSLLDHTLWRGCTTLALPESPAVVISESLRDELAGTLAFERAQVLYQGVPLERFESITRATNRGPCRLLYVGQLHDYKGPHVAIEALGELSQRRADLAPTLTIVGEGDAAYAERLRARGAALGVPVVLRGRLPHGEMPAVYAQHDVLLFTSLWSEPFGLTHLEAMASGLAVVATPSGGTAELMRDGQGILGVTAGDASALAARIEQLQDEPALRERLGHEGRALVRRRYGLERYVTDLEQALERQVRNAGAHQVAA